MKSYYRVMLGQKSAFAEECFQKGIIASGFLFDIDLSRKLAEDWRAFNKEFIPVYLSKNPNKSKIAAGLSCGFLWTVAKGIKEGDIDLSPNRLGGYRAGEVIGSYFYKPEDKLPHQRKVRWFPQTIDRSEMSDTLRHSAGSIGTVSNISRYSAEIENLIVGQKPPSLISTDETVEDPAMFALEEHLEDFLVKNWKQTELGKDYDIYEEEGDPVGQQYPADTGFMDILAISKDRRELLVVELKKGRASDAVVGQIQRYMGYVLEELAEDGQKVKGIIIALDDDPKIRRALAVTRNIEFYKYQVSFKLKKI